jgi:predicted ATPase
MVAVQLAPLVERELELQTVERLLAGARAGSGGAVVFEGPSGIGKTSLLAATRAGAGDLRGGASSSASCRSGLSGSSWSQ